MTATSPHTGPTHANDLNRRAIALAALSQSVYLVDTIARKGSADAEDSAALTESIFIQSDQGNIDQLYGGADRLATGIRIAKSLLSGGDLAQAKTLMGYSAGLLAIEKRLRRDQQMCRDVAEGIARIDKQRHYFGSVMHPSITAAIADLYGETISTMKPRIIVRGKTEFLSQQENTRRVRTLLMAGLRAAHLWHSHGGGHLTLLLRRRALLRELEQLQKQNHQA